MKIGKRWLSTTLILPVILSGLFVGGVGCSPQGQGTSQKKGKEPIAVVVAQAQQKDFDIFLSAFGHVSSYNRVEVKPRVSGHIVGIHFKEGDAVKKGDLLFEIDPRKTQVSLAQAQAALSRDQSKLTNAIHNHERAKALFEKALISEEEMDTQTTGLLSARATVDADQASVDDILLNLEFSKVTAPISGRTGSIQVDLGNVVSAGTDALVSINEIQPMSVVFSVSEKYLPTLRSILNTPKAVVKAYDNTTGELIATGKLDFMENHIDRTTGMISVSARFENEGEVLWPGQFVRVVMLLETLPQSIVIPSIAIQTGQKGAFVYKVHPDHSLEMCPVTVGVQRELESVIKAGLQAGDVIVTDGQLRLSPDAKVTIHSSLDAAVETVLAPEKEASPDAPSTTEPQP